jgi:hypothetical protein
MSSSSESSSPVSSSSVNSSSKSLSPQDSDEEVVKSIRQLLDSEKDSWEDSKKGRGIIHQSKLTAPRNYELSSKKSTPGSWPKRIAKIVLPLVLAGGAVKVNNNFKQYAEKERARQNTILRIQQMDAAEDDYRKSLPKLFKEKKQKWDEF